MSAITSYDPSDFDVVSTCNPVLVKMFQRAAEAFDPEVTHFLRLYLQKLYLNHKLSKDNIEDIDVLIAQLSVETDIPPSEQAKDHTEDLGVQMRENQKKAAACNKDIDYMRKTIRDIVPRTCEYLDQKISRFSEHPPPSRSDSLVEKLAQFYVLEYRKMHGSKGQLQQPENTFRVDIVTLIQYNGGEPNPPMTEFVSLFTDWKRFLHILAERTANLQARMLGSPEGYGLTLDNGKWLYEVMTDGNAGPPEDLTTEQEYERMRNVIATLGETQNIRIIHELMWKMPRALQERQRRGDADPQWRRGVEMLGESEELWDEHGQLYPPIPSYFRIAIKCEPARLPRLRDEIKERQAVAKFFDDEADAIEEVLTGVKRDRRNDGPAARRRRAEHEARMERQKKERSERKKRYRRGC